MSTKPKFINFTDVIEILRDRDIKTAYIIFIGILIVGLFIKFALSGIYSSDGSVGSANAVIWGYGIATFAILGIIIVNVDPTINDFAGFKKLPWSLILTIVILIWFISLNVKYFTSINKKNVPEQYYKWSNYSSILLFFLIGINVFIFIIKDFSNNEPRLTQYADQISGYGIVLSILNLIVITIIQITLDCFTVDNDDSITMYNKLVSK
jgi:hypothetical protein